MGAIRFTFPNENVNQMAPIQFIIFFQNINQTLGIRFIRSSSFPTQIHRRQQPNHQINYSNHQCHSQIANKHLKFLIFHLFEALIQIEANT